MNERTAIGQRWRRLGAEGRQRTDRRVDLRDEAMKLYVRADVLRLTNWRASQAAKAGNPGPEGSVGKAVGAILNQDITEAVLDMMGPAGQVGYDFTFRRPTIAALTGGTPGHAFLRARANTIEGGTTEVMKNILGEQVLGLPGEPRTDKDIPWIDVPRG